MHANISLVAIEELVADYNFIKDNLLSTEVSVAQNIQRHLTKMFILSCASYYENTIINVLKAYSQKHSERYKQLPHGFDLMDRTSFFKMFDFGREKLKNANAFLNPMSLGSEFKEALIAEISENEEKELNMRAFQEICSMRNSLAHNDLITYSDVSSKSFEDIRALHNQATKFLHLIVQKFTVDRLNGLLPAVGEITPA